MRQALFAVVLVAASFAGGAAVNGPGLRWAQSQLAGRLGLDDDDAPPPSPASPGEAEPIAPLVNEPGVGQTKPDTAKPADAAKPSDTPKAPEPSAAAPSPAPAPTPPPSDPPKAPEPAVALPAVSAVPPLERPEPLTTARDNEAAPDPAPAAGVAASTPPPTPAPSPASAPRDEAVGRAAVPAGEPADWAEVRLALKALGVSRYGTDGEPGGRARFHCVIPLAGRRAVGQHFEAEADDELQAARAALKRVALWRATEAAPAP